MLVMIGHGVGVESTPVFWLVPSKETSGIDMMLHL